MDDKQFERLLTALERIADALERHGTEAPESPPSYTCGNCGELGVMHSQTSQPC